MESLKRLEEIAKECLKDIKAIDSKVSVAEGNLAFLESKKTSLSAEISDLESKKSAVQQSIGTLEIESRKKIDESMREIKFREEHLTSERADLKTKLYQADSARAEAETAREKYAALYLEYLDKSQEIEDKIQSILAAAGK